MCRGETGRLIPHIDRLFIQRIPHMAGSAAAASTHGGPGPCGRLGHGLLTCERLIQQFGNAHAQ
jgi:hypothetical protein